jgi:hypothetical protein
MPCPLILLDLITLIMLVTTHDIFLKGTGGTYMSLYILIYNIVSYLKGVTVDGIWIGEWIY